jgi:hypothetical protein
MTLDSIRGFAAPQRFSKNENTLGVAAVRLAADAMKKEMPISGENTSGLAVV